MEIELYRDVMDRVRAKNRDLIINLTIGPGGRFVPSDHDPKVAGPGTTLMRRRSASSMSSSCDRTSARSISTP